MLLNGHQKDCCFLDNGIRCGLIYQPSGICKDSLYNCFIYTVNRISTSVEYGSYPFLHLNHGYECV
jgi:hypothetical protein